MNCSYLGAKLLRNELTMRLSTISYYADFWISIALIAIFAAHGSTMNWRGGAEWFGCVALGLACWTLLEYVIHRWVYHGIPYFKQQHEHHHEEPLEFIGAPPLIGIVLILSVFYAPLMSNHPLVASGLTSGVLAGYSIYQLLHHADHHWSPRPGSWFHRARHFHALHHFHSEQANFGITTSFWDWAFGTRAKVRQRSAV